MKKWIAFMLLFAIMLSCCACAGQQPETTEPTSQPTVPTTEATEPAPTEEVDMKSPEFLYGHINQLEPVDGVYKIWNEVGVQNMADHPEATFEVLCNIDMKGATLRPIGSTAKPFTGTIKGGNFTISNFTVVGESDESFGFVAVNEGVVRNLVFSNMTLQPNANAKYIGALVGLNKNRVTRCTIQSGSMVVENAAEDACVGGAVGMNSKEVSNNDVFVDLIVTAPGSAAVGGIVGVTTGGTVEYCDTEGKLTITGQNKTAGLFAGKASDVNFTDCVFIGADNSLNGVIFEDYAGEGENVQATACMRRDNKVAPLSAGQAELRDKVVAAMRELGTVVWKVKKDIPNSTYVTKYTYMGLPYNAYCSSAERFYYCVDEAGYLKDFVYDMAESKGYTMYLGSDCSSSVQQAWWVVSNSSEFFRTGGMLPTLGLGCLPVGDYEWDFYLQGTGSYKTEYTSLICEATGEQRMYEAYAQLRRGDAIMYQVEAGGHARMASADAVVVRDDNGVINPEYSYVLMHEQGAGFTDESNNIKTTWRIDYRYTFANLYYDGALPLTCEELVTGVMEPVECKLNGGADGYAGMFSGVVETNYQINCVTLKITDSKGNVAAEKFLFPSVERSGDYGTYHHKARGLCTTYELGSFATAMQGIQFVAGEEYTYTVTASLATGDKFELKNDTFTLGSVQ